MGHSNRKITTASPSSDRPNPPYAKFQKKLKTALDGHLDKSSFPQHTASRGSNVSFSSKPPTTHHAQNPPYHVFQSFNNRDAPPQKSYNQGFRRSNVLIPKPHDDSNEKDSRDSDDEEDVSEIEHDIRKKKLKVSHTDSSKEQKPKPDSREEKLAKLRGRSFFRSSFRSTHLQPLQQGQAGFSPEQMHNMKSTLQKQQQNHFSNMSKQQHMMFQNFMSQMQQRQMMPQFPPAQHNVLFNPPSNNGKQPAHPAKKHPVANSLDTSELRRKVQQGGTNIRKAWTHFLNTKKSVVVRVEEISNYLFNDESPGSMHATQEILKKKSPFFKRVKPGEFECHSVREVEHIERTQLRQAKEEYSRKVTVARIARKLSKIGEVDEKSLENIIQDQSRDLDKKKSQFLSQSQKDFDTEDESTLKELKRYALGLPAANTISGSSYTNTDQLVVESILNPLGIEKEPSASFKLCRKLDLFESDNIPLMRSKHLQPGQFQLQFSDKIIEEANRIKNGYQSISDPDEKNRRDFRSLAAFAIDDEGTLEVDDAISVKPLKDGSIKLYIHIADATKYIQPDDEMSKAALERVSSIYLPDSQFPMLPTQLSVDVLSLSEKQENDALTFVATLDKKGNLHDYHVVPSRIAKVQKLTYDSFDEALQSPVNQPSLKALLKAANIRLKHRLLQGAHNFPSGAGELSSSIKVNGADIDMKRKFTSKHSRRIVEECMIVANEISAKFAAENNIIIPFRGTHGSHMERTHCEQDIEKIVNNKPIQSAEDLIERVRANGFQVDSADKRTGAGMFSSPRPHKALGVKSYTFATSPLRRYIDLLVHHQLKSWIRGREQFSWEEVQGQLNRVEPKQKQILSLQRESGQFWSLKFFESKQGEVFMGVVCGIDSILSDKPEQFAMLVNLVLPDHGYHTKVRVDRDVSVGDEVNIRCVHASTSTSSIRFVEV